MTETLWSRNAPGPFWQCQPDFPPEVWDEAVRCALPALGRADRHADVDQLLQLILGEGQFGAHHFELSRAKKIYYRVKPLLTRSIIRSLRRLYNRSAGKTHQLHYPIEDCYVRFQREVLRQALLTVDQAQVTLKCLWPDGRPYAFVITHDIETGDGQRFAAAVADLDQEYGFRSCFNFVPERYPVDYGLIADLQARGFEVGVHGLRHDGRLFDSEAIFQARAVRINRYLQGFGAVGFRAPFTHRNPAWMQALEIEYDSSFFDTDPYEPIAGGCMSIHPYFIGRFVELPMTLIQDHTLICLMGETTPRLWLEKIDFVRRHNGLALINTHPDYLRQCKIQDVYRAFLEAMSAASDYWHALPRDAARWWTSRAACGPIDADHPVRLAVALREGDSIRILRTDEVPT